MFQGWGKISSILFWQKSKLIHLQKQFAFSKVKKEETQIKSSDPQKCHETSDLKH